MSKLKYYDGTNWKTVNGQVTGDTLPIGAIMPFGGTTVPTGWMLCIGQELSRSSYPELYSVIGDSFGGDDERETFYLPNLKGRVIVGQDTTQTEFDSIGETGGEKTHTLTTQEMPTHNHNLKYSASLVYTIGGTQAEIGGGNVTAGETTVNTGGGQAHNNLQPYLVTNYIIKVRQIAGLVGSVTNNYSSSQTDTYSCEYVNDAILENYSTTEQVVGKWIDGKPIYRKIINNVSITAGVGNFVASGITNMDTLVKLEGNLKYTGNNQWITIPSYYSSTIFISANYDYTQNKIFWDCGLFTGTGYFIVEYTKTTD